MEDVNEVLDYWKDFNLLDKKEKLDQTCIEIRDLKTTSITGRKKLNDATKEFRQQSNEDQLIHLTDLLKAYQDEIDQLSRRSKFCESAFLSLFKSLFEAPDPVPIIESYVHHLSSSSVHRLEVEKLKAELNQYEEEFQLLKNQDITIRKLEDQINEYKSKIDEIVLEEVKKRIVEIEEKSENKIAHVVEIQKAVEKRLQIAVESMKQAHLSNEKAQNQLYEVSTQSEIRLCALGIENNLLAEGTQRLNSRIIELENEVNHYKHIVERNTHTMNMSSSSDMRNMNNNSNNVNASSIINSAEITSNDDIQTLKLVVNELRTELRKKDDFIYTEKTRFDQNLHTFSQQLITEKNQLSKLRQELSERPLKDDYISIKRQLKLLQKITFHSNSDDENNNDDDDKAPENTGPLDEKYQLDMLLASRMKKLEVELSDLRREIKSFQLKENSYKETIENYKKSTTNTNVLVTRLEKDLEEQIRINSQNSNHLSHFSQQLLSSQTVTLNKDSNDQFHMMTSLPDSKKAAVNSMSDLNNIISGGSVITPNKSINNISNTNIINETNNSSTTVASTTTTTNNNNSSMVSIIQGQRDRYKQKLTQMETQLADTQKQLKLMTEIKLQMENDNVALYAKIRYLQNYQNRSNNSSGNKWQNDLNIRSTLSSSGWKLHKGHQNNYHDIEESNSNEVEKRYADIYEQNMNPFDEFSKHEKQLRVQELSVPDRIVLNTMLAFVSSANGRRLIIIYLGSMHVMVFFVLYYITHFHHSCVAV